MLARAEDDWNDAARLSGRDPRYWNEVALAAIARRDAATAMHDTAGVGAMLDRAGAALTRAEAVDPAWGDTYVHRARLDSIAGRTDMIAGHIRRAVAAGVRSPEGWARLTERLLMAGDLAAAEAVTKRFLAADGSFVPAWRAMAQYVYTPQRRLDEAIRAQRMAFALSRGGPDARRDSLALAELIRAASR